MASKTRRKPAPTKAVAVAGGDGEELTPFHTRCTGVAKRRRGAPCNNSPLPHTDRCRSHPRPPNSALTAASVRMSVAGVGWKTWRWGDTAWQLEAWRLYDIIGEMRKYANMIGALVSKCRLYVAEIDQNGEPTKEVEDPEIAALAQAPLGKGPAKDEALRLLGIDLAVVGEAYIVAEAGGGPDGDDIWYVISGSEITAQGNTLIITRPAARGLSGELLFREGEDLLIRCWTPHPRRTMWADSSIRSAIPVLRKIEATMKRSFAELDSRLAGAGLLLMAQGVDFPRGDGVSSGVDGLAQVLMQTMATSIEDRSSSEAMVPIIATLPADVVDKVKHLTFWSELSDKIQEMEDAAIRRLAVELDIPPEALTGIGGTNHWNAWAVEESTIKTFIEPILQRIAEALDHGFLDPALEFMGLDPEQYTFQFDTTPLKVRPDRAADANTLHGQLILSDEATRKANNFNDEDAPTPEEQVRRQLLSALPAKPELLADPNVQKILGISGLFDDKIATIGQPPQPEPLPGEEPAPGGQPDEAGAPKPDEPSGASQRSEPNTNPARGEGTASSSDAATMSVLQPVCSYAMVHALGLAGSRLVPHRQRDQWGPGVVKHLLNYHHGAVSVERANKELRGAWDTLGWALEQADPDGRFDPELVTRFLHAHCLKVLVGGRAYDPAVLAAELAAAEPRLRAAAQLVAV